MLQGGAFGGHFRFSFGGFARESRFAGFVAGFGVCGGVFLALFGADGGFAVAVVVDKGDGARADAGADAAFDAVEEAVLVEALALAVSAVPVELLREEFHGAGVGAAGAADAVFFAWRGGGGQEQEAVAGFFQSGAVDGLRVAHHGAADDEAGVGICTTGLGDEVVYRGADARAQVLRGGKRFAGEGDVAFG